MGAARSIVFAVHALALAWHARHSSLEALTVVLLALRILAAAALKVLVLALVDLVLKCLGISLEDVLDGLPPLLLVLLIIEALFLLLVVALAVLTTVALSA